MTLPANMTSQDGGIRVAELPQDPRWVNLIGERNGRLRVLSLARTTKEPGRDRACWWNVECKCGEKEVLSSRSFSRATECNRCQHIKKFISEFKPRLDQHFTLKGFSHIQARSNPKYRGQYTWTCRCRCGELFKVTSHHISNARSCAKCSLKRVSEKAIGRRQPARKRNVATAEIRLLLEQSYEITNRSERAARGLTTRQIAKQIGWNVSAVKDLAGEMGLIKVAPKPSRPWVTEEEGIVSRMRRAALGSIRSSLRSRGYTRSRGEVSDRIKECEFCEHDPCYDAGEVIALLGFEDQKVLERVVREDKLIPEETTGSKQRFHRLEIKWFLLSHPEEYELRRVDGVFFRLLVINRRFEAEEAKAA